MDVRWNLTSDQFWKKANYVRNLALGMAGSLSHSGLTPFIFAMPFLVHPLVFGMFGQTMKNDGLIPVKSVIHFLILGLMALLYLY